MPPGGAVRNRRNTAPAAPEELIGQITPRRLHNTEEDPLPIAQVDSKLWQRKQLMEQRVLTLEQVCKAVQSSSTESLEDENKVPYSSPHMPFRITPPSSREDPEAPLGSHSLGADMSMSEMNLMHMRGSISIPISPQSSSVAIQEMEQFALQAEDNAHRAKQLADWANNIVRQLKTGVPSPGNNLFRTDTHLNGLPVLLEGTSVDPMPVEKSSCTETLKEPMGDGTPQAFVSKSDGHVRPEDDSTATSSTSNHVPEAKSKKSHDQHSSRDKCIIM